MACSLSWGSAFYSSLALAPCLPSTDALKIFAKLGANIRNVYTVLNAQDLAWHLNPLLGTARQHCIPTFKGLLTGTNKQDQAKSLPLTLTLGSAQWEVRGRAV